MLHSFINPLDHEIFLLGCVISVSYEFRIVLKFRISLNKVLKSEFCVMSLCKIQHLVTIGPIEIIPIFSDGI